MSRVPSEEVHLEKKRQGEGCEIAEEEEEEPKRQKVEDEDEDMDEEQLEKKGQGEGCEIAEEEEDEPKPQKVEDVDEDEDEDMDEDPDFSLGDSDDDDADNRIFKCVESGAGTDKLTVLQNDKEGYECDKKRLCNIRQHDFKFGSPVFDIFKVKLILNDDNYSKGVLSYLYGKITIPRTSGNPNRYTTYYSAEKDDSVPITFTPRKHIIVPLSGPDTGRPPIIYFPQLTVNLAFMFNNKRLFQDSCSHPYDDGDGSPTSKCGLIDFGSTIGRGSKNRFWIFRDLVDYLPSDPIKVAAYYGVYMGAWATVHVEMAKKGVSSIYGLIFARSCLFYSRFRLLSIPSDQKRVIEASGSAHFVPIDLTRKVVSVPSPSSLIIGVVLYDQDGNQIVKDKTIFRALPHGRDEASIGTTAGDVIRIGVEWGSKPTQSDWEFSLL